MKVLSAKNSCLLSKTLVLLPLTLGFLEEARASPQQLGEHLSDGTNDCLELDRREIAQAYVLPTTPWG